MKVYLVRHGHKAAGDHFNSRLRHRDQPLSRVGRRASRALARYFRGRAISAIRVSEYVRTLETARPLARRLGIAPAPDARLNEIDIGLLDGLTDEEIRIRFPEAWRATQERSSDCRWPGGETGAEAQQRIVSFMRDQEANEGDLLVVAHDGIIRLFLCHVLGIPVWRRFGMKVDPVGITEVEWDAERQTWNLVRFNQVPG